MLVVNKSAASADPKNETSRHGADGLAKKGDSYYCFDKKTWAFGCSTYDGNCHHDGECLDRRAWDDEATGWAVRAGWGDFCAKGIGPKYGFPLRTSACIPKYHTKMISFTPTKIRKGQPTRFVFTPRTSSPWPKEKAIVRIVKGNNVGCMGVWDRTAKIATESTILPVKEQWRLRPEGYDSYAGAREEEAYNPNIQGVPRPKPGGSKHCFENGRHGVCSPDLPYATEPYIEWDGVVIDKGLWMADYGYEEPRHHVCLCDMSGSNGTKHCMAPKNWHDLGPLELETPRDQFSGGVRHPFDGDLLVEYTCKDADDINKASRRYVGGEMNGLAAVDLHNLCAMKCLENEACLGYAMGFDCRCFLKGQGVKIDPRGWGLEFFQRKVVPDEDWHYYPKTNYHSVGTEVGILDNPTLEGAVVPYSGLNETVMPITGSFPDMKGQP